MNFLFLSVTGMGWLALTLDCFVSIFAILLLFHIVLKFPMCTTTGESELHHSNAMIGLPVVVNNAHNNLTMHDNLKTRHMNAGTRVRPPVTQLGLALVA
jgi:hypothetical protein